MDLGYTIDHLVKTVLHVLPLLPERSANCSNSPGRTGNRKCHLTHVENHEASYTPGVQLLDKKVWAGLESAQLKETETVIVMRTLVMRMETLNLFGVG